MTSDQDEIQVLSEALLGVTSRTETDEVLQALVASARTLVDAEYAALGVPGESGGFAAFFTAGVSDEQQRRIGPVPRAHGLLGELARDARPYRSSDVRNDEAFSWWPEAHPELGPFLAAPIVDRGEVLGTIYVANPPGTAGFGAAEERRLEFLAAHAAIAMMRARLLERERELALLDERSRIARDLHDAVSQRLFSLRLTLGAADTLAHRDNEGDPQRLREELGTATELAASALEELRAVVAELRPPALREDGLVAALRKHLEVMGRAYRVSLRFDVEGDPAPDLEDAAEEAVFRIAQEAVHNAVRHGRPANIEVRLWSDENALQLTVTDDGTGFTHDASSGDGRQLGLASMQERARELRGRLVVRSRGETAGTTVRLEVPR